LAEIRVVKGEEDGVKLCIIQFNNSSPFFISFINKEIYEAFHSKNPP
jgi:hypothetical protein